MKKNITFIWPQEPFLPQGLFKHYVYLGETAQYTRQFGDVKIFDLSVKPETRKNIVSIARESDYVFMPIEAYTARSSKMLSELIKDNGEAKRIAYGTIASVNPRVLTPYFDAVLSKGSWEQAIKQIMISPDEFFSGLENRVHIERKQSDGTEWAQPPLDLLPMEQYLKVHPGQLEIRVQRGCAHNCEFCGEKYRVPERRVYHRDSSDIVKFINKNPDFFYYIDATTFTQDREWAIKTIREIGKTGIKWRTVTRADKIDEELAKEFGENGCVKIGFGIETFSPKLQKQMRKIVKNETIVNASHYLNKYGVTPRGFLIMGLPGQTGDDVRETQKQLEDMGIEYRWKEYIPFSEIATIEDIQDFKKYERDKFPKHKIPGLTNEEYAKLLSIER
jgi:radical SAM superfamily enzyme YgiQ (UPF0313 family)